MEIDEMFLAPIIKPFNEKGIKKEDTVEEVKPTNSLVVDFISLLEGWKTRCKNLHWSAPSKDIHEYLDEFHDILSSFQDSIAENYMGIEGTIEPNTVVGTLCEATNANDFINQVKDKTLDFYGSLPIELTYKGIVSESENFIYNINKYIYLFSLCR
jgi:Sec7-like guanine-nucleotide exchange factor